jgi:hypothetical protein
MNGENPKDKNVLRLLVYVHPLALFIYVLYGVFILKATVLIMPFV